MTLIVGIRCADGIVIGSDGAATLGEAAFGQNTVIQPVTKLQIISERIIMGVSGPVGLGQLYCDSVKRANQKLGKGSLASVQRELQQVLIKDATQAVQASQLWANLQGPGAIRLAATSSLIAMWVQGQPELIQCNQVGQAEAATDDLPYVSIGSGQTLADPFLAFLRRVFWTNTSPRLAQGIFAVVWTLTHAVKVTTGGASEPIQLMTLTSENNKPAGKVIPDHELQEHRQSVDGAELYLAAFARKEIM